MAMRTTNNTKGDLAELRITALLLEHGMAINSLTQSDTGWDLHCHLPETPLWDVSKLSGNTSWPLSGRTAHFQVKSGESGDLNRETVRGWLTGTATGVPTLMFWTCEYGDIFSTPASLSKWLDIASEEIEKEVKTQVAKAEKEAKIAEEAKEAGRETKEKLEKKYREFRFVASGSVTKNQAPLENYIYNSNYFPAILQLWAIYPAVAFEYPELTAWINRDNADGETHALARIATDLTLAKWVHNGYGSSTPQDSLIRDLKSSLTDAEVDSPESYAHSFFENDNETLLAGDGNYSYSSVPNAISATIDNQNPSVSASKLLYVLKKLYNAHP